jgi:hypothetical protein
MPFFTKKPVTIEARQYDGSLESRLEIGEWINSSGHEAHVGNVLVIVTLEGEHRADPGDWVIKGVAGEFYPCKPEIFAATYCPAKAEPEPAAGEPVDRSQFSDGYHTFAELYEHRHALMLAFMRAMPELCWFSRRHADGELPFESDEWFIVGAQLPTGVITYHLPAALWETACATGAAELKQGRSWDGHTAQDVIERLTQWAVRGDRPCSELAI